MTHDTQSDSGLYIADLEAVSTIEGLIVESGKSVTEIMEDARRVAIIALNADLRALMMKYWDVRRSYSGKVGNSRWSRREAGGGELVVLCRPLPSATMHIGRVGLIAQNGGTHTLTITSNVPETADITVDVPCTANELSTVAADISLPMYSEMIDLVEYRFSHDEDHCVAKLQACGSCRLKFNYHNPRFRSAGIGSYISIAGVKNGKFINSSAGIVLGATFECRTDNVFCDEALSYETNPAALMFSEAIQYKAGSVVVWNCLRNPNLNRVLMENIEDLREAAKYYERKYRDKMLFISKHYDIDHDCICKKRSSWISSKR